LESTTTKVQEKRLEQEPGMMSNAAIVASIITRQAVSVFPTFLARLIVTMPSTLANSWMPKYFRVLPPLTTAEICRGNLISVPDCVTMLISPSGHVQVLHHAHWDKSIPVYEEFKNLWTLQIPHAIIAPMGLVKPATINEYDEIIDKV
jgi:hypothetical protein